MMVFVWGWLMMFGAASAAISPTSIKTVVAFGDSLTDTGNFFKILKYPPAPYWNGRFSNGPIWVEELASYLSNATLNNYAFGGSTANVSNTAGVKLAENFPDLRKQVSSFEKDNVSRNLDGSSTLFAILTGGNDILYQVEFQGSVYVSSITGAIVDAVVRLISNKGSNILACNMPALHLMPHLQSNETTFLKVKTAVEEFNQLFNASMITLKNHYPNVTITINDISKLSLFAASPEGAKQFNFTNLKDPCFNVTSNSTCATPESYFFWDSRHPTAKFQNIVGQFAFNQLFQLPGYFIQNAAATAASSVGYSDRIISHGLGVWIVVVLVGVVL
ncbi:GDSL-like Lipase/Acylhydrolase-domain-containing protein [Obelidium mucronatum]|nr:GDSL-like Lipase/Acylhydrolase-domain-containing protein [Obelidium mucronatum]